MSIKLEICTRAQKEYATIKDRYFSPNATWEIDRRKYDHRYNRLLFKSSILKPLITKVKGWPYPNPNYLSGKDERWTKVRKN